MAGKERIPLLRRTLLLLLLCELAPPLRALHGSIDSNPCTIERRQVASGREIPRVTDHPVIYALGDSWNAKFRQLVSLEALSSSHGDVSVVLSSSNSYSSDRTTSTLQQYFDLMAAQSDACASGITSNFNSSTTSTGGRHTTAITADGAAIDTPSRDCRNSTQTFYMFGENFGTEWRDLYAHYIIPSTFTPAQASLSFGVGGFGSGVAFHMHGPGFSEVLHGAKRWLLYPPRTHFKWDPSATTLQWLNDVYPGLKAHEMPLECVIAPGEVLYFPSAWYHAIVNVAPYTAFVSSFT